MEITFNWIGFLMGIAVLYIVLTIIMLYYIAVYMANKRGRSTLNWFLLSLLYSPITSIIILLLIGETKEKWRERIIEEDKLRSNYRNTNSDSESNLEKWLKENPEKSINDYYYNKQ